MLKSSLSLTRLLIFILAAGISEIYGQFFPCGYRLFPLFKKNDIALLVLDHMRY